MSDAGGDPGGETGGAPGAATTIPTEADITPVLNNLLRTCDLNKMTLRIVMTKLAEHFSVEAADLVSRKKFVKSAIETFLANAYHPEDEDSDQRDDAPYDEEDAVDDDGEGPSTPRKSGRTKAKTKRPRTVKDFVNKKIYLTNLEKAVVLAEPLAEFLEELVLPRTHVAKRISAYIKKNNLQNPNDRRQIICDDKLKALFKTDTFTFFSVNKLTSNLLYKVEEIDDEELKKLAEECNEKRLAEKKAEHAAKVASGDYPGGSAETTSNKKPKRERSANGLTKPWRLSPALAAVCGGNEMPRTQVVKGIWAYIKENNLNSGKIVKCDEKLQAVFEGNTEVTNFGLNKFISAHLTKIAPGEETTPAE